MTNKVKPFFIRITDDMTPQMVQDAFDKCHRLGAIASNNDDIENLSNWSYFGVCSEDGTYLSNSERCYIDAQEITLDQLDEWLGLKSEVEWKNGDECQYSDVNWLFCGFHPTNGLAIVANNDNPGSHQIITVDVSLLSKPETPEQKADRERIEGIEKIRSDIAYAGDEINTATRLYDLGYRKQ